MAEANALYKLIRVEYTSNTDILQSIDERNRFFSCLIESNIERLLRHISGAGVDVGELQNKWVNLEYMLAGSKQMLRKRITILRHDVEQHATALTASVSKFTQEWVCF